MHAHSFEPIGDERARTLILGSMPGKASLRANQYYAHPRNAFWPILDSVLGPPAAPEYEGRCAHAIDHGLAIWDVLKMCTRLSSLDSDIVESSVVPNDFGAFLRNHPGIRKIYFNGKKAERLFEKHVLPALPVDLPRLTRARLPSTSPANTMTYELKLADWSTIKT